eukprot:TRINITY_DN18797_c0_g1_i1.p1 TRINITY_DN18797_c0_g1~~TRINITY_DN18797_c0_g1_i1.p1  ORF type:complete len:424 (+),score=115.61 TRINITY_DN18797_c0_g1_i1:90-1361(+)
MCIRDRVKVIEAENTYKAQQQQENQRNSRRRNPRQRKPSDRYKKRWEDLKVIATKFKNSDPQSFYKDFADQKCLPQLPARFAFSRLGEFFAKQAKEAKSCSFRRNCKNRLRQLYRKCAALVTTPAGHCRLSGDVNKPGGACDINKAVTGDSIDGPPQVAFSLNSPSPPVSASRRRRGPVPRQRKGCPNHASQFQDNHSVRLACGIAKWATEDIRTKCSTNSTSDSCQQMRRINMNAVNKCFELKAKKFNYGHLQAMGTACKTKAFTGCNTCNLTDPTTSSQCMALSLSTWKCSSFKKPQCVTAMFQHLRACDQAVCGRSDPKLCHDSKKSAQEACGSDFPRLGDPAFDPTVPGSSSNPRCVQVEVGFTPNGSTTGVIAVLPTGYHPVSGGMTPGEMKEETTSPMLWAEEQFEGKPYQLSLIHI